MLPLGLESVNNTGPGPHVSLSYQTHSNMDTVQDMSLSLSVCKDSTPALTGHATYAPLNYNVPSIVLPSKCTKQNQRNWSDLGQH